MTAENHAYVLQKANCEVYLSTKHVVKDIKTALQYAPEIQYMVAPRLSELFRDTEPIAIEYTKLWDDAKDDPWLVFHSSGTTGEPSLLSCQRFLYKLRQRPSNHSNYWSRSPQANHAHISNGGQFGSSSRLAGCRRKPYSSVHQQTMVYTFANITCKFSVIT